MSSASRRMTKSTTMPGNEVFREKGWLSRTPEDFRRGVLERSAAKSFEAGATIYSVGDPPRGLYGIAKGLVGVELALPGREPRLAYAGSSGAWFGFGTVVGQRAELATLVARQDCDLRFFPSSAIDEMIRQDPSCWRHFARVGLGDLKRAWTLCDDLMRRHHVDRILAVLLHFSDCRLPTSSELQAIDVALTQEEIARVANVGRTAVGTVLRDLEAEGLIGLAYKQIRIYSPPALQSRLSATDDRL